MDLWIWQRRTFYFTFILNISFSLAHHFIIESLLKKLFIGLNQKFTNLTWPFTSLDLHFIIKPKQSFILSSKKPELVNSDLHMFIHCSKPWVLGIFLSHSDYLFASHVVSFLQILLYFSFCKILQGFSLRLANMEG